MLIFLEVVVKVLQEFKDHLVFLDYKVIQVLEVKEILVLQDNLVPMVALGLLVILV